MSKRAVLGIRSDLTSGRVLLPPQSGTVAEGSRNFTWHVIFGTDLLSGAFGWLIIVPSSVSDNSPLSVNSTFTSGTAAKLHEAIESHAAAAIIPMRLIGLDLASIIE